MVQPLLTLVLFVAVAQGGATTSTVGTFTRFIFKGGVKAPAVAVAPSVPGKGRGLLALDDVDAGNNMISVPRELCLTPTNYLTTIAKTGPVGAQLAEVGKQLLQTPEGSSCLLALSLLHERALGEASHLAPYLAMLPPPDELAHPLLWDPSYLESLLKGSHLVGRLSRLRSDLIDEFNGLTEDVFVHDATAFPPSTFDASQYIWAHAIVLSRALPLQAPQEVALVPLIDLANHAQGAPHTWMSTADTVALVAGCRVSPSDAVCIDYGCLTPRSTWEFFYSYGCVPELDGITAEEAAAHWLEQGGRPLQVELFAQDDPLILPKKGLLVALGADEMSLDDGVEVQLRPSAPDEMAPFLRLGLASAANSPELAEELASWKADPVGVWTRLQSPINAELEGLVTEQAIQVCEAALEPLPPSIPMAMAAAREAPSTEQQVREKAAARVLLGERHALEACREHWLQMREALASS